MTNTTIALETSVIAEPGLHERSVGGKVFLLDAKSVMHALENEVAVAIWTAVRDAPDEGVTVEAIAATIAEGYQVEPATASRDALDFARLLHARGILTTAD